MANRRLLWVFLSVFAAAFTVSGGEGIAPVKKPDWSLYYAGEYVYERNCQVCHGRRGDGKGKWAGNIQPKPRSFKHANFKYRSTPFGKLPTDEDLKRTIRGGRSNTAMGMFTKLSERDLKAVVEYIKFFSPKWRDPEFFAPPVELPPEPEWFANLKQRTEHARQGREIFQVACLQCHGERADGKGPNAATLKDALDRPIKPANLRSPYLRSGKTHRDLIRVLMTGLNGTPMISFAEALTPEQMWNVVAYLDLIRSQEVSRRAQR